MRLPGLLSRASQVRILPGAPRIPGHLTAWLAAPRLICPISGVDFIARFIARGSWLESLLLPAETRDATAVIERR
jgi:hypothetical protein